MRRVFKPLYWAVTLQLRARLRERAVVRRLRESGLVDSDYYCRSYPDVDTPQLDPVVHYVRHGASEGRNPNPFFDTSFYLAGNPDVALPGHNPLDHFHSHGWREGRDPAPHFSIAAYLAVNPDVREGESDPLQHYLLFGKPEGRPLQPRVERANQEPTPAPAPAGPRISLRSIEGASAGRGEEQADDPIVVCIAHVVPFPPRAGNHLRIYRYLRWLERRGYEVVMISSPLPGEELSEAQLEEAARGLTNLIYCHRDGELRTALSPRIQRLVEGLAGREALPLPAEVAGGVDADLARSEAIFCPDVALRTALHLDAQLDGPSVMIAHYVFSTRFLGYLRPATLKIIDTIDVFSTKLHKVAAYGIEGEIILEHEEERQLLLRGDVVLAIQPEEARELENLVPDREVITAGIDFEAAPEDCAALPPRSAKPTLLLIASGNALNIRGLRDFLQYAWPLVLRDHPDATLLVAGAVCSSLPPEAPGVRALGFVDSVDELYRRSHVVINPAVAGTGLKIKTVEAMAAYRPIVTWPLGVDGLPPELTRLCLVASDWYQFYIHVSACLQEGRAEAYSRRERDQIGVSLSAAHNYAQLTELVDRHCRRRGAPAHRRAAQAAPSHQEAAH
jgi:glycosyltransferase involved in cell wall biosynthesis